MNTVDWVIVGCFGRTHGIKGLITVHSFTEPRDNILRYSDWHIMVVDQWQPIKLLHIETQNKGILARLEGYDSREQVSALTNKKIAINREQFPLLSPGEYYWHELIGMEVVNLQGLHFGRVSDIMATGANDVLVVEGERQRLIPYLPEQFISEINTQQRLITVDWDADF